MMCHFRLWAALLVAGFTSLLSTAASTVSIKVSADAELRENDNLSSGVNSGANGELSSRYNGTTRNEIVALRFDLTGYTFAQLTNVTLTVTQFRDDTQSRVVGLYGLHHDATGTLGSFTAENWDESTVMFATMPGLTFDSNSTTRSIASGQSTYLGQVTYAAGSKGATVTFSDPAITTFLQQYGGSNAVTFLLAQPPATTAAGQALIASKEATALSGGTPAGLAGDFAAVLNFGVNAITSAPLAGLVITNVSLVPGSVVLSGGGGAASGWFALLSSPSLSAPAGNWSALSTNAFDSLGRFSVTSSIAPGSAAGFFRVVTTDAPPVPPDFGLYGFATMNGGTTGGAGGPTVTVSTFAEFDNHARVQPGPRIIQVNGTINLGTSNARVTSNKTIVGLGTNATLIGNLKGSGVTNVIIRNLTLTNPNAVGDGDGLSFDNVRNAWVDHCTFVDCGDGSLDIKNGADWITVSWCKFYYTFNSGHNFVNLIGHSDSNGSTDAGKLRVTFHHNWWSTLCVERMPRVRFGRVHVYNNYFNSPGNNYCIRAALESETLAEYNLFENVDEPFEYYITSGTPGKIKEQHNAFVNVSNRIPANDTVFTPAYTYTPDLATVIPGMVTNHAGAGKGPFAP